MMADSRVQWWGDGPAPVLDWTNGPEIMAIHRAQYRRLSDYAQRWPAQGGEDELALSEQSVCSQNGEDGVIAQVLSRIGVANATFVEFGVETGAEGNCVCLADHRGWSGWFLEADEDQHRQLAAKYAWNRRIHTVRSVVTAENINQLFAQLGVPAVVDVLSIDIDGADYEVWRALTVIRARLVVIEYNSAVDPKLAVVPRDPRAPWDGTQNFGSSLGAIAAVANEKGYDLVYLESRGVNAFFLDRAVSWPGAKGEDVVGRTPNFFMTRSQHPGFDPTLSFFAPLPSPETADSVDLP
jgi:hypothetical protein